MGRYQRVRVAADRVRAGQVPSERRPDARPRPSSAARPSATARETWRRGSASPSGADSRVAVRGGYGMYGHRVARRRRRELRAATGIFTYAATPGQTGFPTCLTCTPVVYDAQRRRKHAAGAQHQRIPARHGVVLLAVLRHLQTAGLRERHIRESPEPGGSWASSGNSGPARRLGRLCQAALDGSRKPYLTAHLLSHVGRPGADGGGGRRHAPDCARQGGGYRRINVVENLGVADYDGLQTTLRWQGARAFVSMSYTLSKATNTTEPDGNAAGPNDYNRTRRGRTGAQHPRPAASRSDITAGLRPQLASARPFNALTGTTTTATARRIGR